MLRIYNILAVSKALVVLGDGKCMWIWKLERVQIPFCLLQLYAYTWLITSTGLVCLFARYKLIRQYMDLMWSVYAALLVCFSWYAPLSFASNIKLMTQELYLVISADLSDQLSCAFCAWLNHNEQEQSITKKKECVGRKCSEWERGRKQMPPADQLSPPCS